MSFLRQKLKWLCIIIPWHSFSTFSLVGAHDDILLTYHWRKLNDAFQWDLNKVDEKIHKQNSCLNNATYLLLIKNGYHKNGN